MNKQGLSLSLLDLMTCSLGAMLLLFFLVVVFKDRMQFLETPTTHESGESAIPFILVVYAMNQQELFSNDDSPLRIKGADGPDQSDVAAGPSHAVLYLREPLPPGARIVLGPFERQGEFTVQGIEGGRRVYSTTKKVDADQQTAIQIWPVSESTAP